MKLPPKRARKILMEELVLRVLHACQQSLNNHGQKYSFVDTTARKTRHNNIHIHPTAELDEGCQIGEGTSIWHFSHIMKGSAIGRNCRIGQNCVIGPNALIGNNCKIQNNVCVYEGVTLEDDCFCGEKGQCPECKKKFLNHGNYIELIQEFTTEGHGNTRKIKK